MLTGMMLASLGLIATAAGLSLWSRELSVASLVWLTRSPRENRRPEIEPRRLALLLAGPGVLVQLCGGFVASRPQYDRISIIVVAAAWSVVAAAVAAIRSS